MTDVILPQRVQDAWLYHWAPASKRKSIGRYGLVPGKLSVCKSWRPPFVCFALHPLSAWQMSGGIHPEIAEWDLWTVHTHDLEHGYEVLPYDDGSPKEVRVYTKTPGAALFYVGARAQTTGDRGDV